MLKFIEVDEWGDDLYECTGCFEIIRIGDYIYELGLHPNMILGHVLCDGAEIDIVTGEVVS